MTELTGVTQSPGTGIQKSLEGSEARYTTAGEGREEGWGGRRDGREGGEMAAGRRDGGLRGGMAAVYGLSVALGGGMQDVQRCCGVWHHGID